MAAPIVLASPPEVLTILAANPSLSLSVWRENTDGNSITLTSVSFFGQSYVNIAYAMSMIPGVVRRRLVSICTNTSHTAAIEVATLLDVPAGRSLSQTPFFWEEKIVACVGSRFADGGPVFEETWVVGSEGVAVG